MDTTALLHKVAQFRILDRRRLDQPLNPTERARWLQLQREIGRALVDNVPHPKEADQREWIRLRSELKARFCDNGAPAVIANISTGGLYIESERELSRSQTVEIELELEEPIRAEVEVMWTAPGPRHAFGGRFVNLSKDKEYTINELVHHLLEEKIINPPKGPIEMEY